MSDLYTEFLAFTESWMARREMMRPAPAPRPVRVFKELPAPTLVDYRAALSRHDWFYQYSDDPSAFRKGSASWLKVTALADLLDADRSIWNAVAPMEFRRNKESAHG